MILLFLCLFVQTQEAQPLENHLKQRQVDLSQLANILSVLKQNSLIEPTKQLSSSAINGLLQPLDPHSNYFNAEAFQELKASQGGSFLGIGIRVLTHRSHLFLSEVKPNSPASKAGLQWGDEITYIEGIKTRQKNMQELINKIRGKRGSSILFRVRKFISGIEHEISIVREEIPNTNISTILVIPAKKETDKTGFIVLEDFGQTSSAEMKTAVLQLMDQGCSYIVIDLRNNPGGLLQQAIECANLFLPPGSVVVKTQGRYQTESHAYKTSSEPPFYKGPLAILINQGTASAAEIVAGALQDHDRAIILGSQSWGKGLVQSVFSIPPGETGLALTTARYFTPLGRDIQGSYKDIYAYLQPDSGETFFFRNKTEEEAFVTTRSGRKLFSSRGIGPDIFFFDYEKQLADRILAYKHSLALFILMDPHQKPHELSWFSTEFHHFFQTHNGFIHKSFVDSSISGELYRQYLVFMESTVLNLDNQNQRILKDPLLALALKAQPQAESMCLTCFNHQPLPSQTIKTLLDLSIRSGSKKGTFN